jgi:hypothetical protein
MNAMTAQVPLKKRGGKNVFDESIEDEIALKYFGQNITAKQLKAEYGHLAKGGTISISGIKQIASRAWPRATAKLAQQTLAG